MQCDTSDEQERILDWFYEIHVRSCRPWGALVVVSRIFSDLLSHGHRSLVEYWWVGALWLAISDSERARGISATSEKLRSDVATSSQRPLPPPPRPRAAVLPPSQHDANYISHTLLALGIHEFKLIFHNNNPFVFQKHAHWLTRKNILTGRPLIKNVMEAMV